MLHFLGWKNLLVDSVASRLLGECEGQVILQCDQKMTKIAFRHQVQGKFFIRETYSWTSVVTPCLEKKSLESVFRIVCLFE